MDANLDLVVVSIQEEEGTKYNNSKSKLIWLMKSLKIAYELYSVKLFVRFFILLRTCLPT